MKIVQLVYSSLHLDQKGGNLVKVTVNKHIHLLNVEAFRMDHNCHFCNGKIDLEGNENTYVVDDMNKYPYERFFCSYRCVLEYSGCEDSLGSHQEDLEGEG